MTIEMLTSFFKWCTIINVGLLLYSVAIQMLAPEFVYKVQSRMVPISRENFNSVYYGFLGGYKILILVFNVVPYIALLIIQ